LRKRFCAEGDIRRFWFESRVCTERRGFRGDSSWRSAKGGAATPCSPATGTECVLAGARRSNGRGSASEEMQEKHHDTDDQQDMNEPAGNVKSQEPKQPKNDEYGSD